MSALHWVCFRPTRAHDWRLDTIRAESAGHARGILLDRFARSASHMVEVRWIKPVEPGPGVREFSKANEPGDMSEQLHEKEKAAW